MWSSGGRARSSASAARKRRHKRVPVLRARLHSRMRLDAPRPHSPVRFSRSSTATHMASCASSLAVSMFTCGGMAAGRPGSAVSERTKACRDRGLPFRTVILSAPPSPHARTLPTSLKTPSHRADWAGRTSPHSARTCPGCGAGSRALRRQSTAQCARGRACACSIKAVAWLAGRWSTGRGWPTVRACPAGPGPGPATAVAARPSRAGPRPGLRGADPVPDRRSQFPRNPPHRAGTAAFPQAPAPARALTPESALPCMNLSNVTFRLSAGR